jgi:hypothetical protein
MQFAQRVAQVLSKEITTPRSKRLSDVSHTDEPEQLVIS